MVDSFPEKSYTQSKVEHSEQRAKQVH